MLLNRSKFIQHLRRIACAGQCKDVVFDHGFATTALVPDYSLMIAAPGFEGAVPLKTAIGVAKLEDLINALQLSPGEGNEGMEVDIQVEDARLVIDDRPRMWQSHPTAEPKYISTRVEPETADKLFGIAGKGLKVPLTQPALEGLRKAYQLYKPEQVYVQAGPEGVRLGLGDDRTVQVEIPLMGKVKKWTGGDAYTLLFSRHLIDVAAVVTDFTSAVLYLNGPDKAIRVDDGGYEYILAPRLTSAEVPAPKKTATKKKK